MSDTKDKNGKARGQETAELTKGDNLEGRQRHYLQNFESENSDISAFAARDFSLIIET